MTPQRTVRLYDVTDNIWDVIDHHISNHIQQTLFMRVRNIVASEAETICIHVYSAIYL